MIPGHYDMVVRQGDTFDETFTFVNNLLTDYTALMQWRDRDTGALVLSCDSEASPCTLDIAVGGVDSVLTPVITAVQTAGLAPGIYNYDLQLTSPTPLFVVKTMLEGTVQITEDITAP